MLRSSRKLGYLALLTGFMLAGSPAFAAGSDNPSPTTGSAAPGATSPMTSVPSATSPTGTPGASTTAGGTMTSHRTARSRIKTAHNTSGISNTRGVIPGQAAGTNAAGTPNSSPGGTVPGAPTTNNPAAGK